MPVIDPLVMGIVHDFNNVLFVLSGTLELLESEPADRHYAIAATMREAVDKATSITRPLLAYARRANRVEPEWVDVNDAIRHLHRVLSRLAGGAVSVNCQLLARASVVEIGPSLLDRVLMNLVANARDAMPDGGRIEIVTRSTPPCPTPESMAEAAGTVCIEVIDAGVGMSDDTRRRMFDAFFTTKDADRGTGIGLATVLDIVEGAGGSINVVSTPGKGTTVQLFLPLLSNGTI